MPRSGYKISYEGRGKPLFSKTEHAVQSSQRPGDGPQHIISKFFRRENEIENILGRMFKLRTTVDGS